MGKMHADAGEDFLPRDRLEMWNVSKETMRFACAYDRGGKESEGGG